MGGIIKSIGKAIKSVFKAVGKFVKKIAPVLMVAAVVIAAPAVWAAIAPAAPVVPAAGSGLALSPLAYAPAAAAPPALLAAPAAASTAPALLAAPSTAGAAAGLTGSGTVNSILAGGAAGKATAGAVVSGATTGTGSLASIFTPEAALTLTKTGNIPEMLRAVGPDATGQQAGANLNLRMASAPDGILNPTVQQQSVNALSNYDKAVLDQEISKMMADNPTFFADATEKSGMFGKVGGVFRGFSEWVKNNQLVAGIGLQALGAALSKPEKEERLVALAAGGAGPDGRVYEGGRMIDFGQSRYASPEYKAAYAAAKQPAQDQPVYSQQAGTQGGVAPINPTPTPVAATNLPTPDTASGLINPPAPAKVTVANNDLVNKGLLGGVKITGTA